MCHLIGFNSTCTVPLKKSFLEKIEVETETNQVSGSDLEELQRMKKQVKCLEAAVQIQNVGIV